MVDRGSRGALRPDAPDALDVSRAPRTYVHGVDYGGWIGGVLLPLEPLAAIVWLVGVLSWPVIRNRRHGRSRAPASRHATGSLGRVLAFAWGPPLLVGTGLALTGAGVWLATLALGGLTVMGGLHLTRLRAHRGLVPGVVTGLFVLAALGFAQLTWERIAWNDAPTATSTLGVRGGVPVARIDGSEGALAGAATWRVREGASSMWIDVRIETRAAPPSAPSGRETSTPTAEPNDDAFVEVVWRDVGDRNLARRTVASLPSTGPIVIDERLAVPTEDASWMRLLVWLPPSLDATVDVRRVASLMANGSALDADRRAPTRWGFGAGHPNLAGHGWGVLALGTVAAASTTPSALAVATGGLLLILLSGSRAALAVFLVTLPVLLWLRRHRLVRESGARTPTRLRRSCRLRSRWSVPVAALVAATLLSAGFWFGSDLGRDVTLTDLTRRPEAVRVAVDAIVDHPWSGPDRPFAELHCAALPAASGCLAHPHNVLLEAGVRHGVPGVASVAWIFLALASAAIARRDAVAVTLIASAFVLNLADPSLLEPTLLAGLGIGAFARGPTPESSESSQTHRATVRDES